jgi:hypothetical protein
MWNTTVMILSPCLALVIGAIGNGVVLLCLSLLKNFKMCVPAQYVNTRTSYVDSHPLLSRNIEFLMLGIIQC